MYCDDFISMIVITLLLHLVTPRGTLIVTAEAVANTRDIFVANFSGNKLANKDGFFGRSDPFLVISR